MCALPLGLGKISCIGMQPTDTGQKTETEAKENYLSAHLGPLSNPYFSGYGGCYPR